MTETQERVEQALKEMVAEMPYRKITVHELCLRARISRNTFYANYEEKDDVVRAIFERGVIQPIRDLNMLLTAAELNPLMNRMNEQMYERLKNDGEFYRNLTGPRLGSDDIFLRVVTRIVYKLNMELIPKTTTIEDPWQLDYASYFYASSQAMLMQKWVHDDFAVSPKELSDFYSKMTGGFWRSVAK